MAEQQPARAQSSQRAWTSCGLKLGAGQSAVTECNASLGARPAVGAVNSVAPQPDCAGRIIANVLARKDAFDGLLHGPDRLDDSASKTPGQASVSKTCDSSARR